LHWPQRAAFDAAVKGSRFGRPHDGHATIIPVASARQRPW
jgi:hypothetical protein